MKTLRLSVSDRLLLPQLLPQQGGKIEMLLANSISQKVMLTPDEITEFRVRDDGSGTVKWENGREVEFEFTPEQVEILKAASKRADNEKKITVQTLGLIEKIDEL